MLLNFDYQLFVCKRAGFAQSGTHPLPALTDCAPAVKEPTGTPVTPQYSLFAAFGHLGAGLTGGLSGLAAGMAIGIVGDAGVRATAQQP